MAKHISEFECNDCLSDKVYFDQFEGITFAYAMNASQRESALFHYVLTPVIAASPREAPRETRAYREMLRRRGKKVPKIKESALRDELFVIPGAAMSPADVIKVLRDFIEQIEKRGMFVGKYKDAYIRENLSGEFEEE